MGGGKLYVNGEQFAKIKSNTMFSLMSRTDGKREFGGVPLDAFYSLKPKFNLSGTSSDEIPSSFYARFEDIRKRNRPGSKRRQNFEGGFAGDPEGGAGRIGCFA